MNSRLLRSTVLVGGVAVTAAYFGRRRLDTRCRRVSFDQLPACSACRQLVAKARLNAGGDAVPESWGVRESGVLSTWPDASTGSSKSRWISSFVALQVELPVSQLAAYGCAASDGTPATGAKQDDTGHLMRNLFASFMDAIAYGVEGWLVNDNVPPLSFTPGTHLFGNTKSMAAFMLGSWNTEEGRSLEPPTLPSEAGIPVSEFPSNRPVISSRKDAATPSAGAVLYWSFPKSIVRGSQRASTYGLPTKLMDGGFQELIVEKVSAEKAVATYITVECSDVYPAGRQSGDFGKLPWLAYETHVAYAQFLLLGAATRIRRGS